MKILAVLYVRNCRMGPQRRRCAGCGGTGPGSERVIYWYGSLIQADGRRKQGIEAQRWDVGKGYGRSDDINSALRSAALSTQNVGFGQPGVIPLYGNVGIVLQRQFNRIVQADRELPATD